MANKLRKKEWKIQEPDMKVFMSLMVVLIPMLLLSAEFAKISIIDLNLPKDAGSQTTTNVKKRPEDKSNKLQLTTMITDSAITIGAKSGFMPSIYYHEYHRYISNDDGHDFTVPYVKGQVAKHPVTGQEMKVYERYDIFLYVTDENHGPIQKCLYSKKTRTMMVGTKFQPVSSVKTGDTLFTVTTPRRMEIVASTEDYEPKQLSAYHELKNRLLTIKEKFADADDVDNCSVVADNLVIYDKVVQIMDAARAAHFPNISIAKFRAEG